LAVLNVDRAALRSCKVVWFVGFIVSLHLEWWSDAWLICQLLKNAAYRFFGTGVLSELLADTAKEELRIQPLRKSQHSC